MEGPGENQMTRRNLHRATMNGYAADCADNGAQAARECRRRACVSLALAWVCLPMLFAGWWPMSLPALLFVRSAWQFDRVGRSIQRRRCGRPGRIS